MSRVGKQPIIIPENVEVKLDGNLLLVKGPKGELKRKLYPGIDLKIEDKQIIVQPKNKKGDKKENRAIWGTFRSLVANMIEGLSRGFEKKMEFEGVGYKASTKGNKLALDLGYSHPIEVEAPEGIDFAVEKKTIIVSGINKELVGKIAAEIRAKRKPEPYKGKGIRYENETIRRKVGKKAAVMEE